MRQPPSPAGSTQFAGPPDSAPTPTQSVPQSHDPQPTEQKETDMTQPQPPAPAPTMGWPKYNYRMRQLFLGDAAKVPPLGKKERELLDSEEAERQRKLSEEAAVERIRREEQEAKARIKELAKL